MNYTVDITANAHDELKEAYLWLLERTPQHAPIWYDSAFVAIRSLQQFPERCRVIQQQRYPYEIRQLVYGDKLHGYRILFTIQGDRVVVLHVYHGALNRP